MQWTYRRESARAQESTVNTSPSGGGRRLAGLVRLGLPRDLSARANLRVKFSSLRAGCARCPRCGGRL